MHLWKRRRITACVWCDRLFDCNVKRPWLMRVQPNPVERKPRRHVAGLPRLPCCVDNVVVESLPNGGPDKTRSQIHKNRSRCRQDQFVSVFLLTHGPDGGCTWVEVGDVLRFCCFQETLRHVASIYWRSQQPHKPVLSVLPFLGASARL